MEELKALLLEMSNSASGTWEVEHLFSYPGQQYLWSRMTRISELTAAYQAREESESLSD
jgi:hypothetical protein